MIISFSGLDGAGKTTQINRLLENYCTLGARIGSVYSVLPDIRYHSEMELKNLYEYLSHFDVIHLRFRLNSNRNSLIMSRLELKTPPKHILAIMAAIRGYYDHMSLYRNVICPLVKCKKTIIFDRYYYDELAFKHVYGCPKALLNAFYRRTLEPNLKFYIQIPVEKCIERNKERPDSQVALYQSKKCIQLLIEEFREICVKKKLIAIDGCLSEDEIAKNVLEHICMDGSNNHTMHTYNNC